MFRAHCTETKSPCFTTELKDRNKTWNWDPSEVSMTHINKMQHLLYVRPK
jgi:hypothetical protein